MITKEDCINNNMAFIDGTETSENKLLKFLKENYPSVIQDTEINLAELKNALQMPVDEKTNGYGLNFIGRNFARAKYASKTTKELQLNTELSKNIDTTQNLVLKGDNLDSLKILKNHYSGKIKCIYIDPPYNTDKDEFVYPDKFDKEEREVLGFANLSEDDIDRMDFSFKTKKSHNGWLAFMYPRLLIARDLLRKDGVIFISINDIEQANLKLLCDDVFGEDNFITQFIRKGSGGRQDSQHYAIVHEYILCYARTKSIFISGKKQKKDAVYPFYDKKKKKFYKTQLLRKWGDNSKRIDRANLYYPITDPDGNDNFPMLSDTEEGRWRWEKTTMDKNIKLGLVEFKKNKNKWIAYEKLFESDEEKENSMLYATIIDDISNSTGATLLKEMFEAKVFDYPKPVDLIIRILKAGIFANTTDKESPIILDFFAGSGTTGEAVMQANADDSGNRKFILCQFDEPINKDKKKEAYKFCTDNNIPPIISRITIERLKRAGEKIKKEIEEHNISVSLLEEQKKKVPDIGFKVFDSVTAPELTVDENGTILLPEILTDTISRVYNMVFTVGLDEPTQVPETVKDDCMYRIGNNYYLTNCSKLNSSDYETALKNGKVFIDGWTADLNGTLQNYKEDVKIVF